MSSQVIGFPDGKIKLSDRTIFTEPNGLERIEDSYIIPPKVLKTFQEQVKLGLKMSILWSLFIADEGDLKSYETMVVERLDYANVGGGLTNVRVTYVGLYSTQKPRPLIYINPIVGNSYVHNKWSVSAEYVTFIGEAGGSTEIALVDANKAFTGVRNPKALNGYPIPDGKIQPYQVQADSLPKGTQIGWLTCPLFYDSCYDIPAQGNSLENKSVRAFNYGEFLYLGMCLTNFSVEKFGLYGAVKVEYADAAAYTIGTFFYSCENQNLSFGPCQSSLNYDFPSTT